MVEDKAEAEIHEFEAMCMLVYQPKKKKKKKKDKKTKIQTKRGN